MAVCELVEESPGSHRCRTCRRGWRGSPGRRECHGPVEIATQKPRPSHESEPVLPIVQKTRVGLLLPNWCRGGVERYHEALFRWTPQIEWSGLALTSRSATYLPSLMQLSRQMPVFCDSTVSNSDAPSSGVTVTRSERESIERLVDRSDALVTWAVSDLSAVRRFPGPVITVSHGDGDWLRDRLHPSCESATHFVSVSAAASMAFPEKFMDRVTVIPGGIELDRIAPSRSREEVRQSWGVHDNQIAVGFVGRFSPEKNPLQAAKIVGKLGPRAIAIYHGHNPWGEPEFRKQATEAAGGRIKFIGPEDCHTGDVYAGIDCLVQASPSEGGPLVAMESWLSGVPLITTPVGILLDDVDLAARSFVVSLSDPLAIWCESVLGAISMPVQQKWEAQRIAAERYSAAAAGQRWQKYLKAIT